MADSDDEYDRKRRDKFRGERSSGGGGGGGAVGGDSYRSERRDERRRDEWPERNPFRGRTRPDYREYRGPRDRYSPGRELPPPKRMRMDWGDDIRARYVHDAYGLYGWGGGGHDHYPLHGAHPFGGGGGGGRQSSPAAVHARETAAASNSETQPPMLTLKQFLDTQDDGISDSEVLRKYSEYKLDFKRQQLNEFFVAHKDEEWFKNKYHPEEAQNRRDEQRGFLKRRVDVFTELLDLGQIGSVTIDSNQSEPLLRLLDTVVIKLEGGTDEDLKILDEKPVEFKINDRKVEVSDKDHDDDVIITAVKLVNADDKKKKTGEKEEEDWSDSKQEKVKQKFIDGEENWDSDEETTPKVKEPLKRARSDSESSSSSSTASDHLGKSTEVKREATPVAVLKPQEDQEDDVSQDLESNKKSKEDTEEKEIERTVSSPLKETEGSPKPADEPVEKDEANEKSEASETTTKSKQERQIAEGDATDIDKTETIDLDKEKDPAEEGPRALHRTSSIFLRNLAPTITKDEIEAVCKRYSGYLRVAIADPLVERRWFRRGWVTFTRDVNIKEICWNLNNIRLRDCELGAIVNRDLSRRVRSVNGLTAHKTIVRSDIKLCAKIAHNLDEKFGLWVDSLIKSESNGSSEKRSIPNFGFNTANPVLRNITDYLIEEASAEEDELLGLSAGKEASEGDQLEREPQLLSVLDKLILYLRIVHSVDFYNHCEYPYEDEMPNRCGIIHARGPPPNGKITSTDIQDYIKNFESKMSAFLSKSTTVAEDELKNLGAKDPESEVEKFVLANTQELAKDKWLCPLSGKKFKGPEFIRKHIFNKHNEKVDEVRKEVEYFNNYLKDPKRPQLPEHPGNTRRQPVESPQAAYRPGYPPAGYPPYAAYAPPMIAPRPRNFGGRRGGFGGNNDLRPLIHYRDLDAPRDTGEFL